MSPLTLLLVLASAATHATWNLWAKQVRPVASGAAIAWLLTLVSAILYAPVAVFLIVHHGWRPALTDLPWIAGSGVLHVVYFLVLLRGYRLGDLSVVYPVARGTGPLWAVAGGVLLLREPVTPLSTTGALLIVLGVVVLTAPRAGSGGGPRAGLAYGLLTGALIGTYTLWDSWAVKRVGLPPLIYYWAGETIRIALYAPLALPDRAGLVRAWSTERVRLLGIGILSPFSYILMLFALRSGAVSHVAPAREISILIGAWLGGQVLGERDRTRRVTAAAAFAAGVVALALA